MTGTDIRIGDVIITSGGSKILVLSIDHFDVPTYYLSDPAVARAAKHAVEDDLKRADIAILDERGFRHDSYGKGLCHSCMNEWVSSVLRNGKIIFQRW